MKFSLRLCIHLNWIQNEASIISTFYHTMYYTTKLVVQEIVAKHLISTATASGGEDGDGLKQIDKNVFYTAYNHCNFMTRKRKYTQINLIILPYQTATKCQFFFLIGNP